MRALLLALMLLSMPVLAQERRAPGDWEQKVVVSDGITSWLLQGDVDADVEKYRGKALPRLLAEGWRIENALGGEGSGKGGLAMFVLVRERPGR